MAETINHLIIIFCPVNQAVNAIGLHWSKSDMIVFQWFRDFFSQIESGTFEFAALEK